MIRLSLSVDKISDNEAIHLPLSKSVANRILILQYLYKGKVQTEFDSTCDDVEAMRESLESKSRIKNIGHAGTAMRFLTAFFSVKESSEVILEGSERMHQRPIKLLVSALNSLGADVTYLKNIGYPPLLVKGKKITKEFIEIEGHISSQYISALILVAPFLENGLKIGVKGKLVSRSYIELTLALLRSMGVDIEVKEEPLSFKIHPLLSNKLKVLNQEGDWSAASYYYSIIALSPIGSKLRLCLKGAKHSCQGDRAIVDIMEKAFGVDTELDINSLTLIKKANSIEKFEYNFTNCPDIAQTIMVCAAASGIDFVFDGIETLSIKETNRIEAMQNELAKFNVSLKRKKKGGYCLSGSFQTSNTVIETYNDHRMAMSFAPLGILGPISIEDEGVVSKSYPNFWDDMATIGLISNLI